MAKEMMIVFVYDTECCQDEADDPVDAVLYFHPSWVSDTQKLSLCGQIMGTAHFLRETFGKPNVIALQNGKFVLKEFGRFVLAVGTDRNINQSLLEHRAELLSSLVKLFHRDIQTIYDQFSTSGQYKNVSDKLYHIFETYLPILQYNGNIFQNMPISKLPKSASNIFLEAMHTLQSCQRTAGILGGSILYHNKVIASQLYSTLAKNLILTDPYRIKTTAESIPVKFHVPVGCQLITAFIPHKEYKELLENAERIQTMCNQSLVNWNNSNNTNGNANNNVNNNNITTNAYPFQFKKKIMKRDKSIVFTNIPEEGAAVANGEYNANGFINSNASNENNSEPGAFAPSTATVRPNHLPLRFKNITSKDIPESGFSSSITFDEQDSFPQFIGRTSVCSTPMTENKVLQGNIMPICGNPFGDKNDAINTDKEGDCELGVESNAPDVVVGKQATENQLINNLTNFISNPFTTQVRRNSLIDIGASVKKLSRHLSLRPISMGFIKFMHECDYVADGKIYLKDAEGTMPMNNYYLNDPNYDCDGDAVDDIIDKKQYRTITDPTYPVFNSLGLPISRFLFEEFLNHQNQPDQFIAKNSNNRLNKSNKDDFKQLKTVDSPNSEKIPVDDKNKIEPEVVMRQTEKLSAAINNIKRKSLTLPLKSLTSSNNNNAGKGGKSNVNATAVTPPNDSNIKNIFDKPEQRRKLSGIQLTPLITKLSILALNDERSSGFSSWDTTPGVELGTPLDGAKLFRRRSSVKLDETEQMTYSDANQTIAANGSNDENDLTKVELFICGQNNMTLLLLMKEKSGQKQEIVQSMFDVCISKLPRLEANLNQILNVNMNGDKTDGGYSFFYVDQDWDTLHRGGPWSNTDLTSIEYIRHDLKTNPKLHNIIIRGDESVIYGHQSIGSNVFYKQSAHSQNGLPPPADAMGTISKQARRHLERDHSIILF